MNCKKLLFTLFLFLLVSSIHSPLFAQVTTATISGAVLSKSSDEDLVAAAVVAIHEPSGTRYGTTTRDNGSFTLPNLRVGGPYTIQATYLGYKTYTYNNVFLSLGQKLFLNLRLESEDVQLDDIVITASPNGVMSSERTGAETNIGSKQLQKLPTISRSASDFTRLTPSASGNSFGGRNDQFNNFSLDGSIFNNPFGLDAATPGGQTDAQPVSLDAIEQINVSLAPYDVTQAGFTGASVNAVTKSGTNELKGTVFGFYRNQDMTGSKVRGNDIFVPELAQLQAGFSLGGALVKDKLFFFANFEIERREDLGSNFVASRPNLNGENVSRVEAADLDAVSNVLLDRFGYDTGAYEGYLFDRNNEKGIAKLDWNISDKHTLTATYNFLNASKQQPAHPSALGRRGPDATTLQFRNSGYQINNKIQSGILELRSLFSNTVSNKLQIGLTSFRDSRDAFSAPAPVININRDGIRYIVAGHEPFSINNVLDQDVLQISNNLNIYSGDHTITVGASLEKFSFNNSFNLGVYDPFTYGGGTFGPGFASVDDFVASVNAGELDDAFAGAQSTFDTNNTDGTWALAETNVGQFAVYAQDDWQMSSNFSLTYGLRVDAPLYFDTPEKIQENIDRNCCVDQSLQYVDEDGNPITFDHTQLPKNTTLFSPRVGFNWDINGDNSLKVRGGTGLFSGRLPFVWIGNQVANPNSFFYNVTHPDFKFPQVHRTNLGVDKKLESGWILSTDLIYTKDLNGMMVRNYGINKPTGVLQGVDPRPIYTAADRANDAGNNAYVFTNTEVGYSFNATVQLQRNWDDGLYTSIAYNYLDAKDASSIEAEISSDAYERNPAFGNVNQAVLAPSLYGNRHRFVGSAYKQFEYGTNKKWATSIAMFFEYLEGGRFSYTYSGDINGDGSGLNDLLYIPTGGELNDMAFTGTDEEQNAQRSAFNSFIQQDAYMTSNRGSYVEKYGILSPWYSTWDLRILQDLNLGEGADRKTIQLSLDILNVGNLLNSDWGVRQLPVNTQPVGVSVADGIPTYSFDTSLTNTFTDDFSLNSRWQAQVGLRYIF
ncbi:MAG: carboxypeptidase regulatory-like domain-containing protein [Chitinophagales bacterium]